MQLWVADGAQGSLAVQELPEAVEMLSWESCGGHGLGWLWRTASCSQPPSTVWQGEKITWKAPGAGEGQGGHSPGTIVGRTLIWGTVISFTAIKNGVGGERQTETPITLFSRLSLTLAFPALSFQAVQVDWMGVGPSHFACGSFLTLSPCAS